MTGTFDGGDFVRVILSNNQAQREFLGPLMWKPFVSSSVKRGTDAPIDQRSLEIRQDLGVHCTTMIHDM